MLRLDIKDFAGCRYRVTTKPRNKVKPDDTYSTYNTRATLESFDVEIPLLSMAPGEILTQHEKLQQAASNMHDSPDLLPMCNRQSCFNYFRPCEYWSQCHGKLFTDQVAKVTVYNQDSMQPVGTPVEKPVPDIF